MFFEIWTAPELSRCSQWNRSCFMCNMILVEGAVSILISEIGLWQQVKSDRMRQQVKSDRMQSEKNRSWAVHTLLRNISPIFSSYVVSNFFGHFWYTLMLVSHMLIPFKCILGWRFIWDLVSLLWTLPEQVLSLSYTFCGSLFSVSVLHFITATWFLLGSGLRIVPLIRSHDVGRQRGRPQQSYGVRLEICYHFFWKEMALLSQEIQG
jgi:hypothetical protein